MLVRDGEVIRSTTRDRIRVTVRRSGRYGLRLNRGPVLEALGTPIWFERAKRVRVSTRGC